MTRRGNPITDTRQKSSGFFNFNELAEAKEQTVEFTHVMTGKNVKFPAFITQYSDDYSLTWGSETIFGRMDSVRPYSGTQRKIQLAFKVLAPDLQHAKYNFRKQSLLSQMMYPVYSELLSKGNNTGRTIKAPPLLRIKFMNLVQNKATINAGGLLGTAQGFQFTPNVEAGWYMDERDTKLYPKEYTLSFTFDVLHEETPGFDETGEFMIKDFPYGTQPTTKDDTPFGAVATRDQRRASDEEVMVG